MEEKEQFCEYIKFIIDQHNKEEKLDDAMYDMSPDFFVDFYPFHEYENILVRLLNEKYNLEKDENGETWIEYYLYELEYGKNYKDFPIECPNGETIYLSSPKILYDLITGEFD